MQADIIIVGLVQGVSFRYYASKKASQLGIKGYVENLPNGNVHSLIDGELSKIKLFVDWCRIGSPASKVYELHISYPNNQPIEVRDFYIKR